MKKKLSIVLAVVLTLTLLLTSVAFAHVGHKTIVGYGWFSRGVSNWLEMDHYLGSGEDGRWCGPSSGVSIGRYYRERPLAFYDNNYQHLPANCDIYNYCYVPMYDALYEYMDTQWSGYTEPVNYGPGFVEMALHYEYDRFRCVYYGPESAEGPVNDAFFEEIVNAIDNGWPVALVSTSGQGFSGVPAQPGSDGNGSWPATKWHAIAIEGYSYWQCIFPWPSGGPPSGRRIRCTDSYSRADELWLKWDDFIAAVGENHRHAVIIKDDDPENDGYVEDFEWGSDRDSLEPSGGQVDWDVYASGASVAEIETYLDHVHSGTGSARIYRDGSKSVRACYSLLRPSYIDFYLKKDDTARAYIYNGDGSRLIDVLINDAEQLQYWDTEFHTVYTLSPGQWYHIEFKNIHWGTGKYDIYVNGSRKTYPSATMRDSHLYEGGLHFASFHSSGAFWIDDIKDSLR